MPSSKAGERPIKSAGVSLIFLGNFNPSIFHPEWFMRHELITDDEESVELDAVTPQVASWIQDWLRVAVQPDRCELHAKDEVPSFRVLVDLAKGLFGLLPHVPVSAFGINRYAHFGMESEEAWHTLGFQLFSQEPWKDVIDDPRMLTVQVQAFAADDQGGRMTAVVQPSQPYKNAVFVSTNDHYPREPEEHDADEAIRLLDKVFDRSIEHSSRIIEQIRGL